MLTSTKSVFGKSISVGGGVTGTASLLGPSSSKPGKNVHIWAPLESGNGIVCKSKAVSLSSKYAIEVKGILEIGGEIIGVSVFEHMIGGLIHRNGLQENVDSHFWSEVAESRSIVYKVSAEVSSISLRFTIYPLSMAYDLFSFSDIPENMSVSYFS